MKGMIVFAGRGKPSGGAYFFVRLEDGRKVFLLPGDVRYDSEKELAVGKEVIVNGIREDPKGPRITSATTAGQLLRKEAVAREKSKSFGLILTGLFEESVVEPSSLPIETIDTVKVFIHGDVVGYVNHNRLPKQRKWIPDDGIFGNFTGPDVGVIEINNNGSLVSEAELNLALRAIGARRIITAQRFKELRRQYCSTYTEGEFQPGVLGKSSRRRQEEQRLRK